LRERAVCKTTAKKWLHIAKFFARGGNARVSYQPRSRGWHWYLAPVKTLVNMPDMPAYQMPSPYMPLGTWHLAFGTMVPHIGTWYQLPMTSESVPNWCQPCQRVVPDDARCRCQMPDAKVRPRFRALFGTVALPRNRRARLALPGIIASWQCQLRVAWY